MTSRKYRRSTSYKVTFPTAPSLTAQPKSVELRQEKGAHDILILEFQRSSSIWFEILKTGTPVVFTWNQDGQKNSWMGYVNTVVKQSASQQIRTMQIVCVGASFVLKAKSTRVFKNSTVSEAAEKIAKEFQFKFVGEPTSRRFESLSVAGQSYWEWLQEQASRIGFVILVINTTLYFKPIDKLIDLFISSSAALSGDPVGQPSDTSLRDRTLDSLTVLNSENLDHDILPKRMSRITAGVNPVTSAITGAKMSPSSQRNPLRSSQSGSLFSDYSDEVVHSGLSAKEAAFQEARARKFSIVANVIGQGDPYMHPYSTVVVSGSGVETDGYWVTASVSHNFTLSGFYQVDMRVMSDGLGRTKSTPFRRADGNTSGKVNLTAKVLGLLDGKPPSRVNTQLSVKVPMQVESQQGFNILGNVWRSK